MLSVSCRPTPAKPRQAVRVETITSGANLKRQHVQRIGPSGDAGGRLVQGGRLRCLDPRSRRGNAGATRVRSRPAIAFRRESSLRLSGEADFKARLAELRGMRGDAAAAYARAKADYDRGWTLVSSGTMSQAEFDNVNARYGSASGAVAAANARESEARIALSDANLRAPIDGIVLNRSIEVGALVGPGAVAFTIADLRTMRVVFAVPDSAQHLLTLDQPVTVTTDALAGRSFTGTIEQARVSGRQQDEALRRRGHGL